MFLDLQVVSGVALDDDLLLIWQSARSNSKVDAMAHEARCCVRMSACH